MMDFSGIDVLIAHSIPEEALKGALSEVLKVPASRIAVMHSVEDYPETHAADVVCVVSPAGGDFDQLLSIQTEARPLPYATTVMLIQHLSQLLNTRCLISNDDDGDRNPSSMILMEPNGSSTRVTLDEVALDENRYVIARPQVAR